MYYLKILFNKYSVENDINLEHIERQLIQICAEEGNITKEILYDDYICEIEIQLVSFSRNLNNYTGEKSYIEIPRDILFDHNVNKTDFSITKKNLLSRRVCVYCEKTTATTWYKGPENSILCRDCAQKYKRHKKRINKEISLEELKVFLSENKRSKKREQIKNEEYNESMMEVDNVG